MKTVTSTELRRDSAAVYNQVHSDGAVALKHRDRPRMILITEEALSKALINSDDHAILIADLTF